MKIFFLAVTESQYDIIILTETWLDDKIISSQLFDSSYTVYRVDRNHFNSTKTRGGGVLIAITNTLNCCLDRTLVDNTLEQLWVTLKLAKLNLSIGVLYLPPNRKNDLYSINKHVESIGAIFSNLGAHDHALLFGDYNQSGLIWNSTPTNYLTVNVLESTISAACAALLDGFSLNGLKQINTLCNSHGRLLDLVLSSDSLLGQYKLLEAIAPLTHIDAGHPALSVEIEVPVPPVFELYPNDTELNYHRANYEELNKAFRRTDWTFLESLANIDEAVNYFTQSVNTALVEHIPVRRPTRKPPWGNAHLRHLKRLKSKALRTYSNTRCLIHKQQFTRASNDYRLYNRYLYKCYSLRTQDNLRKNPKQFWTFVNSKRKENGLPVEMFLNTNVACSASEKCTLFASHFKSAFNSSISSTEQASDACRNIPNNACELSNIIICHRQVEFAIAKLKFSTSASSDGIPSCILKRCSNALIHPLTLLFNMSLREGIFPCSWKLSLKFPVHKKGDEQNIENYRGITSLCACSKVFEIVINEILFASCKSYITIDQHGFYPKRSVSTNLVQFTSFCMRKIDSGSQVDAVYTDLKSAFDRVDHNILLLKLDKLGISNGLIRWFESYLTQRKLCVRIGQKSSEPFSNISGVPQGSNLGPLLFSIFINDLSELLPPGYRLFYADDVKIYTTVNGTEDCNRLQEWINTFENWCSMNLLTISIHKCNVISFHRKKSPIIYDYSISNQALLRVDHIRDLGVTLDSALTFRLHYDNIIIKANRQLGFIFKVTNEFRDPHCLRSLYCALVRSILESSVIVWCPYQSTWINRFESVQKKFLRYALRYLPWRDPLNLPPYEQRCRLLGLDTLEHRRCVAQAVFVAKILLGEIEASEILPQLNINAPERPLRQRNFLLLDTRRAVYGQHDPIRFMAARFNNVYQLFDFHSSAASFQRKLSNMYR